MSATTFFHLSIFLRRSRTSPGASWHASLAWTQSPLSGLLRSSRNPLCDQIDSQNVLIQIDIESLACFPVW
jgi:hypothetical protein